jgi:hypothetical protein
MALRVEFMHSPRGSWSRSTAVVKRTDGGLFWWSIAITFLIGLATFSWFFCIYVFTHPEKPFNYKLLNRIHKLEPLKAFTERDAPPGKTLAHRDAYQKFYSFSEENLAQTNSELHRAYITNYKDERPIYLRGHFKILHARPLTNKDVFPSGIVARAVAMVEDEKEFKNVVIEYILPSKAASGVPFHPDDVLRLDTPDQAGKRRLFASILNVQRHEDESLVFTVVPLTYGDHAISQTGSIHGDPPELLNLEAKWPISEDSLGAIMPGSIAVSK